MRLANEHVTFHEKINRAWPYVSVELYFALTEITVRR